jgi:cobalt-zinc-cadmium efflux system membrane fusion protein
VVGQNTRTARAIVELSNPEAQWKPGLYVTAEILTKEFDVPMAIPVTALQQFRDWQVVFAKFGDRYEVRMMQLGQSDGVWVEVLSGIEPGQEFVSENSYALKADLEKAGATHDH